MDSSKLERINRQYNEKSGIYISPSLKSFIRSEPLNPWCTNLIKSGPWCELGGGARSIFESFEEVFPHFEKSDLFSFDGSSAAIEMAPTHSRVQYKMVDLTKTIPGGPYSFILDGHFLHCLDSLPQAFHTLGLIYHALRPNGIFAGEVMMAHKQLSFDHDLQYDPDNFTLSKDGHPIRLIMEAMEWEDLFNSVGFKIDYFVCQSSIKMIPSLERDIPMNGDPECLRFILKKGKL